MSSCTCWLGAEHKSAPSTTMQPRGASGWLKAMALLRRMASTDSRAVAGSVSAMAVVLPAVCRYKATASRKSASFEPNAA
jgi:hypothetical protein